MQAAAHTEPSILLRARGLTKTFQGRVAPVTVFRDLDFALAQGELGAIVGTSGAGKSTLLQILGGLDQASAGSVSFTGPTGEIDITKMRAVDLARWRNREIGFVFQFHHLLPEFSALENVMMPQLIAGVARSVAASQARTSLAQVGLSDRAEHRPGELSGGEQQRVAIARALSNAPRLLLADEPTGNLDEQTGLEIYELIRQLQQATGLTGLIVTHNLRIARACDRAWQLTKGTLTELPHQFSPLPAQQDP